MASEYKLIPFNTYRECLAVTFKNVLSNNGWSIKRALELYKASDQTYKDYLRCKYTLLLLGPKTKEKMKKINEKPILNDKCESNNSDYYKDAKQRFASLLTGDGTEPKRDVVKKGKSFQEDKNKVKTKKTESELTPKRRGNDKFSNSVLKHLQAYVTDSVGEKDKHDLKKEDKQQVKKEPEIDPEVDLKRATKGKELEEELKQGTKGKGPEVDLNQEIKVKELEEDLKQETKKPEMDGKQRTINQERNNQKMPKEEIQYETKQELKQDIKISNKNGTAIISESGNSTIHLDSI